jgi:hypothetical protein
MSLDGQVLVIAFCAIALKLLLWSREENVVGLDIDPDRKNVLHLDDSGLRFQAGARPEGDEGRVAKTRCFRLDRR